MLILGIIEIKLLIGNNHNTDRVNRGGSWNNNAANCRSANRSYNTPSSRFNYLGFRLALFF